MAAPPAAAKISQLSALPVSLDLNTAYVPVAFSGFNYRMPLSQIAGLVTKDSLGLNNVDNTSDADKPVSRATEQALITKADSGHTHVAADITDLESVVRSYNWAHNHAITEITGLQTALDGKINRGENIDFTQVTGLADILVRKAEVQHAHSIGDVNGLASGLQAIWSELGAKLNTADVVPATVVAGDVQW